MNISARAKYNRTCQQSQIVPMNLFKDKYLILDLWMIAVKNSAKLREKAHTPLLFVNQVQFMLSFRMSRQ